jgi:hypothetical protein
MVVAWVLTLPAAGLVAALIAVLTRRGGNITIVLVAVVAVVALAAVFVVSRRDRVTADNVNDTLVSDMAKDAANPGRADVDRPPADAQATGTGTEVAR